MTHIKNDDEVDGNGKIHSQESCPFYEMGTADFHSYRVEMVGELRQLNAIQLEQSRLLKEAFSQALDKASGVPLKTHYYTVLAVILGVIGADVLQVILNHFK